jgi:Fe-S cluster assembly protein SufB
VDAAAPPEGARVLPRPAAPEWGGKLDEIDFENMYYYIRPTEKQAKSWEDLPADIKNTWDRLGIPEAEKKYLAGVGAQYESEVVYHKLKEDLESQGVLFLDMDSGLREHEELVKEYFGTVIPANDNKFAALNSAVWSGGSFIYVPPGVKIEMPLQAYFRINAENMGQFERTLIIVDEDAYVHYVEGLHRADLHDRLAPLCGRRDHRQAGRALPLHDDPELVAERLQPRHEARGRVRERDHGVGGREPRLEADHEVPGHLAHGRGRARRGALDRLRGRRAAPGRGRQVRPRRAEHDFGHHVEVDLEERRRASYRGLLEVAKGAHGAKSKVVCDALILDEDSRSDTYPYIRSTRTRSTSATRRRSRRSARSSSST